MHRIWSPDYFRISSYRVSLTSGGLPYEVEPGSRPLTPFLSEISHALYQTSGRLQSGSKTSDKPNFGFGGIPRRSRTMTAATVRKSSNQVQDANLMQVGQVVNHPFFGRGSVEKIVGDRTVEVVFDRHGRKTLHLDYAKLEKVEG